MENSLEKKTEGWMNILGRKYNIMNIEVPYIPLSVEQILEHIALKEFSEDGIKKVCTLGRLTHSSRMLGTLHSIAPHVHSSISINLSQCPKKLVFPRLPKGKYASIWNSERIFRINGILRKIDSQVVLFACYIIEVKDEARCQTTMKILSQLTRKRITQYFRTDELDARLETAWNKNEIVKRS